MTDRVAAALAALAELLSRRCVQPPHVGDAEAARRLVTVLVDEQARLDLLAVAAGGVWAAYSSNESVPGNLVAAALLAARSLLPTNIADTERSLMAAALGLLAVRGVGDQPAVDLVNAATSARRVEQNDLALWAAEQALARREQLSAPHESMALLTAAVITHDRATIGEAYQKAAALEPDDLAARAAEALRPTLHPDGTWELVGMAAAVQADDRPAAAASLAAQFAELRTMTNDDLLTGAHLTAIALSRVPFDSDEVRRGLALVVGHLRRRQRLGQIPAAAWSSLDVMIELLMITPVSDAVVLLTELVEALADAGISSVIDLGDDTEEPELAQALLAERAQRGPGWPDLSRCVAGLHGRPALLMRRSRTLAGAGTSRILGLYLTPPASIAIKWTDLGEAETALVNGLATGRPDVIAAMGDRAVGDLITSLLPAGLLERAARHELDSLLVVPEGPLWSIPWQSSPHFAHTTVATTPSLSIHAGLHDSDAPVRRITALVDRTAPGAQLVCEALEEAHAAKRLEVRFTESLDHNDPTDLFLVFAHGGGAGLRFRTGTAHHPIDALRLAHAASARTALVAACWSAATPPVAFPINLPVAMLLSGASRVIGGLWPLPAEATATIVSATVAGLATHGDLTAALRTARTSVQDDILTRWGLAAYGVAG
jgi:hypothetical protein